MIDETLETALKKAIAYGFDKGYVLPPDLTPDHPKANKIRDEALTAIYEIGLECIGADLPERDGPLGLKDFAQNQLRASQRKAWAKACGVAE